MMSQQCVGLLLVLSFCQFGQARNYKAKKKDPNLIKREEMIVMARHLGVTCTYCHDAENFRANQKANYKKALDHLRITRLLNQQGFKSKVRATCFMCHRGQAKPDYLEH